MAGWSTRSRDMKSEKLRRNKSLIKEEIESYWKTKKTLEEGQLDVISDARSESQEQDVNGGGARNMMQRSISMPVDEQKETAILEMHTNHEFGRNNCWWTRSNWAFLNEPRVDAMEKLFRVKKGEF